MNTAIATPARLAAPTSRPTIWTGRVLTGLVATFLLIDAGAKLVPLPQVVEASAKLGIGLDVVRWLGVVLALSTVLHLVRRTELLGAVLVSAYLGGATATHVLSRTPFWFSVVMGVILWVGYALRNEKIRAIALSSDSGRA